MICVGEYREDTTGGGGRKGCLKEVLLRGDAVVVVVWGIDLGVVGANGVEARGRSCGKVEVKCFEVWLVA